MRAAVKVLIALIFIAILAITIFRFEPKRDQWQMPDKIMDTLGIKQGMVIGEAGAGEGYFTFHLSSRIGDTGKVYANDISERALETLEQKARRKGFINIETVLGEETDPLFPVDTLDMVIMVYVLHDVLQPVPFLKNIRKYLKPDAPIVIVDRDPEKYGHEYDYYLKMDKVKKIIHDSGQSLSRIETFLPRDNIYIIEGK